MIIQIAPELTRVTSLRRRLASLPSICQGEGELVKSDSRGHVYRVGLDNHVLAVKWFPPLWTPPSRFMRRLLKGRRGSSIWRRVRLAYCEGLPVVPPIGLYQPGPWYGEAYLVFEWIEGQPLSAVLGDHRMSFGARSRVAAKTAAAVARMHQAGSTHGDLKPRNVLITATDPTFIDPDAMRIHRFPAGLTKRARRDWQTLVSSLNETSVDPALIQKILVRAAPREADVGRSDLNRG